MTLKERLRNPFVQQYLIEIVFPLVGYFFFDWDLLIIGVYYLIDHLSSQILFFRRLSWMNKDKDDSIVPLIVSIVASLVFVMVEVLVLTFLICETQSLELMDVQTKFLLFAKEELWILFPVVLLVYHLKDQFTFYMPRHYLKFDYKASVRVDAIGGAIQLSLLFLGGLLWWKLRIPDFSVILLFLVVKIAYDLTVKKKMDQLVLKK